MPEPKECNSFVPCSKCKHVKFCSKSTSHVGYCKKSSQCITLSNFSSHCIACKNFSELDSYYYNYSETVSGPPKNPDAEERKKTMEFFFPKKDKPKNPDDPWEFL